MEKEKTLIDEENLQDILKMLYVRYGYDFTNYSRASIVRRITGFMMKTAMNDVHDFKINLYNDKNLFDYFLKSITVNVTEMFRDSEFYNALRLKVIPMLATYPIIKIWHAGCSSGEEVFSVAILLHEAGLLSRVKVYATDINPANIEKAKKGIISLAVMKDYTENYIKSGGQNDFASYYTAKYDHAIIRKDLRQNISFSEHNLVTDQIFNEFHLICCRNVIIYFNNLLQNSVINLFYNSLSDFGYLALGFKESLLFSDVKNKFETVGNKEKIFRRIK